MREPSCKTRDLARGWSAVLLWCLPVIALIIRSYYQRTRFILWIPVFPVMGLVCLANAARCGSVGWYITGPLSFLAIVYIVLAQFRLVQLALGYFLDTSLAFSILAFLAEIPFG
jgi:hypothetical protein